MERREAFLQALRKGVCVTDAARAIGLGKSVMYCWKAEDAEFALAWEQALEHQIEQVEAKLFRMAMAGDVTSVIFFLRSRKPEVYNRRMVLAVGGDPNAPPIGVDHSVAPGGRVTFYMPSNQRDEPPSDDEPPLIEGIASDAIDDAA